MKLADHMIIEFQQHLRAEVLPADGVCLVSEREMSMLSGASVELIAPLLDGIRTVADVKREAAPDISAGEVESLLGDLCHANLAYARMAHAEVPANRGTSAFWCLAGLNAGTATRATASARVSVVALGNTSATTAAAACEDAGLVVSGSATDADVSFVVCDDYLDPRLASINSRHLALGRPWLLTVPGGATLWTGPVFQPGTGPCWNCLARRLADNRGTVRLARRLLGESWKPVHPHVSPPGGQQAGLRLAALELAKWVAGVRYSGQDSIHIMDTLTLRGEHHPVRRRPQCPDCGDPGVVALRSMSGFTSWEGDPAHPSRPTPDLVLARYAHLIDPVTGIVPSLRRDPASPDFLPCYLSGRNRAVGADTIGAYRASLRSSCGGKGTSDTEARLGALGEAIERYCSTRHGDELTVRDSYRGLGAAAVHPATCMLVDERQYADRVRWNATCAPAHHVPEPFDENAVLEWVPACSLLGGEQRFLPADMTHLAPETRDEPRQLTADSSGTAAGDSLDDAVTRGFLELVERDAAALWWYNRTSQPAVDVESFDDSWTWRFRSWLAGMNRELWVLDLTSDLGVPVMAAVSRRIGEPGEEVVVGFGSHFDASIALRRALAELGQRLVSADGLADPYLRTWWLRVTTLTQPHLLPDITGASRSAADYETPAGGGGTRQVREITQAAGLDLLALDMTRPDVGMPVAKVVIPGLRHFWPRFATGRLFEVPVRLGRLPAPTTYEELNPVALYT
jgi:bacteriocin biosynthesis cyclodehydratase domain-containing protein